MISKETLRDPSYRNFHRQTSIKLIVASFDDFVHRALAKFRYELIADDQATSRCHAFVSRLTTDPSFRQICQDTVEHFIRIIVHPDTTRFQDWRADLMKDFFISLSSRSFDEALQSTLRHFYDRHFQLLIDHFERFNLIDGYLSQNEHSIDPLRDLWLSVYQQSLTMVDASAMKMSAIEIPVVPELTLPMSVKESQGLPAIRQLLSTRLKDLSDTDLDHDTIEALVTDTMKEKSAYGEQLIHSILINEDLLKYYYQDQLILFHLDGQYSFSRVFLLTLMTSNPRRRSMTRLSQLLIDSNELAEVLCIFQDGLKLCDEQSLLRVIEQQMTPQPSFYSLVDENGHFRLLAPGSSHIDEKFEFHHRVDPFVEISLMNLFELILSPDSLSRIDDLELITSTLSSISLSVLNIPEYDLMNLEKLRSFRSLLRCIQILDPTHALNIFQTCFREEKFDATFQSCAAIDQFIRRLEKSASQRPDPASFDGPLIESTLLKLEIEFLKNWLYHHKDQYWQVLDLINQTENNLWKYSAKILSSIVADLSSSDKIEQSYEFLPDLPERAILGQLDTHLKRLAKHQLKIHRLLVDRLYLEQCLHFTFDDHSIRKLLDSQYDHYIHSVDAICSLDLSESSADLAHVRLVRLLAWVRFYSQCYAYSIIHQVPFKQFEQLDRVLTDSQLPFYSTLKLFLFKPILQQSNYQLDARFRRVTWIDGLEQQMDVGEPRRDRKVILPIPLGVARDEYNRVSSILSDLTNAHEIENLLFQCSSNQRLSYCFHLWVHSAVPS